jgi:DNA primase
MSVVDEIKSKLDIVSYIQRTVPLKKAGRYYKACCPFHSERTPSFVVNPDTQSWRCFGACAEGGDLFSFVMKQNGWTFNEALEELARQAGVQIKPQTPEQREQNDARDRLRGLLKSTAEFFHEQLFNPNDAEAVATLEYARTKRGLSDDTLRRFQIGYAPAGWHHALEALTALGYSEDDLVEAGVASRSDQGRVYDRFRNRLIIPIRDERGRTVGFGARALAPDDNPKYLNSPQSTLFDKSHLLFALDLAGRSIRDSETAVIVEGYLDAIQAHQAGYTNVVAQMGTALTESQLKLIAPRWAKKIILSLDADAAGQSATMRSLEVAREALRADYAGRLSVDIRVLALPGAKDPDDLIRESPGSWEALVAGATSVTDYVIAYEMNTLPTGASAQEREAVARRLLPILAASENDLYRKDNLQKLAVKLRIAERDLLAWAAEQQRTAAQIAAARPPAHHLPSEEPPPELDDYLPGDDLAPVVARPRPTPVQRDVPLEADCLRALLRKPELYYLVNRRFRELAEDADDLERGPLGPLCADDFTHSQYRALMINFIEAVAQEEMEPVEYLNTTLEADLRAELDTILTDQWELLRQKIRFESDLAVTRKQVERTLMPASVTDELVHAALTLRARRLNAELQGIVFLQMDEQNGEDSAAEFARQVNALRAARFRIDRALQHGVRTF